MLTRDDSAKARRGDDFGKGATPRCVTGFGASDGSTTTSARSTPSTSPPSVTMGASTSPRRALLAEALRSRARDGADGGTTRDARARRAPSEDSEYSCDENFVLKSAGGGGGCRRARARWERARRRCRRGGARGEGRGRGLRVRVARGVDADRHPARERWNVTLENVRSNARASDAGRCATRARRRASPPVSGCFDLTTDDLV